MKWTIIVLCLVLLKCNNISSSNNIGNNTQDTKTIHNPNGDTIVNIIMIPSEISDSEYIAKEYYLVTNGDTSNFSCFISLNTVKGSISINYVYEPYQKSYSSFIPEDSSSIINFENVKKISVHESNYKGQLREMQQILDFASKEFDLDELSSIRLVLSSIDSLSDNITSLYKSKFSNNIKTVNNTKVADLIRNSEFTNDLNRILSVYKVEISKVYVDGLIVNVMQNANFHENNKNAPSINSSDWFFDGLVIFSLSTVN